MTSPARLRSFVRRQTRLIELPDAPGIRLHVADDVMSLMALTGIELGVADPPLPFWAFPWAGGLAIVRYLADRPDEVAGRRVLDLATGSGLCAIAALRAGAGSVLAVDIDPLSEAAVALNARANDLRIPFRLGDLLGAPPPPCDVILAGDVSYEEPMADRMSRWLESAAAAGIRVLLGDPGRAYLPGPLDLLATYRVRTTRELENTDVKASSVYAVPSAAAANRRPAAR